MLIVGLGNPGAQYEWTRHNLGFMLIDLLAREAGREVKREECRALVGRAEIEGRTIELVKPQTYMNLSGEAVACLLRKSEELTAKDVIVICDDLALPFGTIRLRPKGSSGGHNGLKSLIAQLKTEESGRRCNGEILFSLPISPSPRQCFLLYVDRRPRQSGRAVRMDAPQPRLYAH